ncbi:unnamed protein product [Urochloa decumbens]|uniref:F-box domain-containing protein n=1 Tax=Urochloa decumbens TaxID=240449 RepID=A0ABC8XEL5_9POAL
MSKRPMSQTRSPAADLPPDDLFLDIFLRLPPEPENLLVASLVCKRWSRIIRDPAFLARFRAFHRATPVLGFYQNIGGRSSIRFVPIADPAPRLSAPECFQNGTCRVLDCRHGRVLICDDSLMALFVWDPMAVTAYDVGSLPELSGEENFTAVLVCSPGNDDHTDCHSAPFRVVYVDNSEDDDQLLVMTLSRMIEMLSTSPEYQKKTTQAAAQVEAVDKEQADSSSSGHQLLSGRFVSCLPSDLREGRM